MMCCCRPKNASSGTPDAVSNVAGPAAAVNRSDTPRQRSRNPPDEPAPVARVMRIVRGLALSYTWEEDVV
jgi:hypothetical protein